MSLALLLALALWPFHPGGDPIHHIRIGGWALETRTDRFTGRVDCRLFRGSAFYVRQAVVFHLPPRVDTFDAAYRVDAGRVFLSRADAADLANQGFALHDDDLNNPSGGLVRIPASRLEGAALVWIQPGPNARPVRFKVSGLSLAVQSARDHGCTIIGTANP
jgi:hypothetical protein